MLKLWFLLLLATTVSCGGLGESFYGHTNSSGTQHNRERDDQYWYFSNSQIPHLPSVSGFVGTHSTHRHLSIHEQTAVLIGEGKHGVWRIHESGHVREYRRKGAVGIDGSVDPNAESLDQTTLNIIRDSYSHDLYDEGLAGYKYPDEKIDKETGYQNYIDINIYHPNYKGKYESHGPIDLPLYYCTMSQGYYPHMEHAWKFARAQPQANKLGPLAQRAGVDVRENWLNVIRFHFFPDTSVWLNVGVGNPATDMPVKNRQQAESRDQTVRFERMDLTKMDMEFYFVERNFFNMPHLLIIAIFANKESPDDYRYIRQDGAYWRELQKRHSNVNVGSVNHFPEMHTINSDTNNSELKKIYGTSLYGLHNTDRLARSMNGGMCPNRGGDFGRYPWSNPGSGWPSTYQEITPLCDAIMIDVKSWANLGIESWTDRTFVLGNAGYVGNLTITHRADANVYGRYTDPFLIRTQADNPYIMDMTTNGQQVDIKDAREGNKPAPVSLKFTYPYLGSLNKVNNVTLNIWQKEEKEENKEEEKNCISVKLEFDEAMKKFGESLKECEEVANVCKDSIVEMRKGTPTEKCKTVDEDDFPDWGFALLAICAVSLFLNIACVICIIVLLYRRQKQKHQPEKSTPSGDHRNAAYNATMSI